MGKENIFFVKPEYYPDVNSSDNELYEISIDDINSLALFATTLEPVPEVTEANGYAGALDEYYKKNTDSHSDCYRKLVTSDFGRIFLNTNIQLILIEKRLRTSGLNENSLQAYERCINNYRYQIDFNHTMYMNDTNDLDDILNQTRKPQ